MDWFNAGLRAEATTRFLGDTEGLGWLESNLASTFPTLPGGGITSASFCSLSDMAGVTGACTVGFDTVCREAASLAAMLEGEGIRSAELSSCTPRALELDELLS